MPFRRRIDYLAFIENQAHIEKGWHEDFGDRKNEIVIIGQDIEEEKITKALDACLATNEELLTQRWKEGYEDVWPVQRAYAV